MEALMASYGDSSDDSEFESPTQPPETNTLKESSSPDLPLPLPPPPVSLLNPPNSMGSLAYSHAAQPSRVRTFAHVEGNYALHVYIPVYIPAAAKKEMTMFLKRASRAVPGLHTVEADISLDKLCKDDLNLEQVALGREFHISLGRTVPIRVHQIDSLVTMLRQKLNNLHRRFWIDFTAWEVFVNDDRTRTFLALEVTASGLSEIRKQIQAVNEVYRLHNLPEFYKDPRPHISVAWAVGDISDSLKIGVQQERRFVAGKDNSLFSAKFGGVECRIGSKTYKICAISDK